MHHIRCTRLTVSLLLALAVAAVSVLASAALTHPPSIRADTEREPSPAPEVASSAPLAEATVEVEVSMHDNHFAPVSLTVPAGTTVVWVNEGQNGHMVTAFDGSWSSEYLAPGERYSLTFNEPDTYVYRCPPHLRQSMSGRIIVTPP